MKKFALVLALLLAFGSLAMAGDIVIAGEATTTFGYNLDTNAYGLKSTVESSISLNVGEGSESSAGEGAWYGVIELNDFSIDWDSGNYDYDLIMENEDGDDVCGVPTDHFWGVRIPVSVTAPDVVAKITDGNLYVQLQTEAGFAADYVASIEEDADGEDASNEYGAPDVAGSLTFGGTFAPATVAIEFATAGDYEDDVHVDGMVLGATIGLDVAPLTVDFAIATGVGYAVDQDLGIAIQVAADVAPLSITVAFDGINEAASSTFLYEIGAAISADIAPLSVGVDVYYGQDVTDSEEDLDVALSVGAAVAALTADATVSLYDVITVSPMVWEFALDLTYAVSEDVVAAAGFSYDSAEVVAAYANVVMTGLVDNVTFTLGWEEGDDLTNDNLGQIILATNIAY